MAIRCTSVHYKELKKHVIGEDGKIIPPPKPKSYAFCFAPLSVSLSLSLTDVLLRFSPGRRFIEKYWLYAIPILLILLVPPQGDDPAEAAKTK